MDSLLRTVYVIQIPVHDKVTFHLETRFMNMVLSNVVNI